MLDTAMTGPLAGFTSEGDYEILSRMEKQLKRRFAIGSHLPEQNIVSNLTKQEYPELVAYKKYYTRRSDKTNFSIVYNKNALHALLDDRHRIAIEIEDVAAIFVRSRREGFPILNEREWHMYEIHVEIFQSEIVQ